MAIALPALDHAMPAEADRLTSGETPRWSLGGGTALALRLGHRISDDIDIFITGIALAELTPRRNPAARAIHPYPQWPGHSLKFEREEGEVDFLSSALQTKPGFSVELFRERSVALETADEIVVKKIRYRAAQFTPRDAFDLACVLEHQPEIISAIARETGDALPRLDAVLDVLGRRGPGAISAQVRPEPTHRHLMVDAVARVRAGIAKASGLVANPMSEAVADAIHDTIRSIDWFQPGGKRGTVRFDWNDVTDGERDRRVAIIDQRPIEAKEELLRRWRHVDPAAFGRWDATGRPPSVDTGIGGPASARKGAPERELHPTRHR